MVIYLKAGGILREKLNPDVDYYTRKVEVTEGRELGGILEDLEIPAGLVAYATLGDTLVKFDYIPLDGDVLTLRAPIAGG